jgi:hypothetical protein
MSKNNLIYLTILLINLFCLSVYAQGTFNEKKYTKSKVRIWVEDHVGYGKRKSKAQENLKKAMLELEITKKKIEDKKRETSLTVPIVKSNEVKPADNWTDEILEEINNITKEIDMLLNGAAELNPFKPKDKNRLTEIEIALTNLINKKIIPFKKVEMQIENAKVLASDYSFETGKSVLSQFAINQIRTFSNDWEKEIQLWLNYSDTEGRKIFKNDKIQIRINVIGYADKQGRGKPEDRIESNRLLSEKRSHNVKSEIQESIKYLEKKYNIGIEFVSIGKGEELPSNVHDLELINNPERRKVIVTTAIYPYSLVKK